MVCNVQVMDEEKTMGKGGQIAWRGSGARRVKSRPVSASRRTQSRSPDALPSTTSGDPQWRRKTKRVNHDLFCSCIRVNITLLRSRI